MIYLNYGAILFDFDGTITESGLGITRSAAYACEKMGLPVPGEDTLRKFVGPPLVPAFREYLGLSEADALKAVGHYRERYNAAGWKENSVYPGITPLLKALKRRGAYLAVASGKPQIFIERIVEYFGLTPYFDKIVGIKVENTHADKRALILEALPEGIDPHSAVMVGDRRFDMEAARALGLHAVGALYGYGTREELLRAGADEIADDVEMLRRILLPGEAPQRGLFITFEGADGCGKSTQLKLLAEHLSARGYEVLCTREPGGCAVSERIRDVVLDIRNLGMSDECEALLYAASRAEHVRTVILPSIAAGKIVLCDRFLDSSFAYQARGRELGDDFIRQINTVAYKAVPDRTLLFVGDREAVLRRLRAGENLDRLEIETDDFFRRVYEGYADICAADPARVHEIDSRGSIDEIFEKVVRDIGDLL